MNVRPSSFSFVIPAAVLLLAGGCSLPQAQSDPTRFYVLSSNADVAEPRKGAPVVHLRPVELASYLRAQPVIVRRGENEIEFREFARWGEPLELGIARVLREELLARGAAGAVINSGTRREAGKTDFNLSVRVLACEGEAKGAVVFRAVWELASTEPNPGEVAHGEYRAGDLRWDGKSEASLARQLSVAVTGLAADIGAALKK